VGRPEEPPKGFFLTIDQNSGSRVFSNESQDPFVTDFQGHSVHKHIVVHSIE